MKLDVYVLGCACLSDGVLDMWIKKRFNLARSSPSNQVSHELGPFYVVSLLIWPINSLFDVLYLLVPADSSNKTFLKQMLSAFSFAHTLTHISRGRWRSLLGIECEMLPMSF